MKKLKALWEKSRDTVVPIVTDFMVEHPNFAMGIIAVVFIAAASFLLNFV